MSQILKTLTPFMEINKEFPFASPIKEWKQSGGKVIGFFGGDIPEEILSAAGALPVWLRGHCSEIPLDDANSYLHIYTCSHMRSILEIALKGDYNYLDGVMSTPYCDGSRRMFDVWDRYIPIPALFFLHTPHKNTPEAEAYYYENMKEFVTSLESTFQKKVTKEALWDAIKTYNQTRKLFIQLYDLRKKDNPPISGAEVMEIYDASAMMPRKDFNILLEKVIDEAKTADRKLDSGHRLMINGTALHNPEYVKGIEDLGSIVVADSLLNGAMGFSDLISEDENTDPLLAITRHYLNKFPAPRMVPSEIRFDKILQMAEDFRIDGMITGVVRYCAPHIYDEIRLSKRFEARGIPSLRLDLEYGMAATGQIKTRVQAFIEMIEERKRKG
ncbi:MAG: 2-hydroxyacyl-CoA dehydratase family protein [Proteobacteria bacterium]|nr:2-hydroxyacyl-CoA dehydratase family protein [Pseudomonadota bacterium]